MIKLANILDGVLAPAVVTDVFALWMVVEVPAMVKVVQYWPGSSGGSFL